MYPKNVLRLQLDDHRVVFISSCLKQDRRTREQYDYNARVSFCYVDADLAAEWETEYGPISVYQCMELPEGTTPVDRSEAKPGDCVRHHIWPCVEYDPAAVSQLAVDEYGLPQAFTDGRWERIFATLRDFVERADERIQGGE